MAFGFSLLLLLVLMTTTQGADLVMVGDIVKTKYMASSTLSPIKVLRRNRESTRGIRSQIRFCCVIFTLFLSSLRILGRKLIHHD